MLEKIEFHSSEKLSKAICELIEAISDAPDGPEGLQKIYQEALRLLHCSLDVERASILLFDPDRVMRFKAWLGISENYRKAVEGHTPWTPEDRNVKALTVPDVTKDEELKPHLPKFLSEDIRALAFIPLMYRGRVIGKFMLYSRTPSDFSDKLSYASTIAQLVAYAVVRNKIETELEKLLAEETKARIGAEKSIQQRDDFLSIASHELKTPLTPIRINFQMMNRYLKSILSENPRAAMMLKIFESTDEQFERFLKLVENLLDVSRITADRLVLSKEHFNLSDLTSDILEKYSSEFKNLGYIVSANIEKNISGYWDKTRIEQIFTNLISNAIKYGLGNPLSFDLHLDKSRNVAIFSVRDNGIGIEKENLEKIFNRFERVAPLGSFGGLGLGLYISKNLAQAHGGNIAVESIPEQGSTFTCSLPVINQ